MELSNDVHFAIAVHQNTSSALKTSSDLPDIHVNWCFGSEMVLQTVFYFKVA